MGRNTKIEWAAHTFNPWRGCTKVAPGCANCYAEAQAKCNSATLGVWGPSGTRVVASESMWRQPVKWNRDAEPDSVSVGMPRVFCGSMCDVFESWPGRVVQSDGSVMWNRSDIGLCTAGQTTVGGVRNERVATLDDVRSRLFRLIDATPNLDWLLLTKRPENVRRMWPVIDKETADMSTLLANHMRAVRLRMASGHAFGDPVEEHVAYAAERDRLAHRPNVWIGTSIACQDDADRNIPELLKCRDLCAKLFVSAEPLVEPVDLLKISGPEGRDRGLYASALHSDHDDRYFKLRGAPIDWVIVGGESGPNARPCCVQWIREIVRQCADAEVPCFVKQVGSHPVMRFDTVDGRRAGIHPEREWPSGTWFGTRRGYERTEWRGHYPYLRDKKGGDPSEWPEDIRVREVPCVKG